MNSRARPWRRGDLVYCSNVHPAESINAVESVLDHFVRQVRIRRDLAGMGSGLWLSRQVASELQDPARLALFAGRLADNGIELFTLNGFPYGNFHVEAVKEGVYRPDWSDPARVAYTADLAEILAACLTKGRDEGTISTLPLGYRRAWTATKQRAAARNLCLLAQKMDELYRRTGRSIRVCLEMEPDGVLETTDEAIDFFRQDLAQAASELAMPPDILDRHLGICFDICHQAVMFEDVKQSLADFVRADISLGKIQVSSALEIKFPGSDEALRALRRFDEPRYLHQVRTLVDGKLHGTSDLPMALETCVLPREDPWRVHFHVPIQAERLESPVLATTRPSISQVLDFLASEPACRPQLEVETYTWQVLPDALRPQSEEALVEGITAELRWLENELNQRELLNPSNP